MINKDNDRVFIEACKKAGLEVETESGDSIKSGLILYDAKGQSYTVDTKGQLQKRTPKTLFDPQRTAVAVPNSMKVVKIAGRKKAGYKITASSKHLPNHSMKRKLKFQGN